MGMEKIFGYFWKFLIEAPTALVKVVLIVQGTFQPLASDLIFDEASRCQRGFTCTVGPDSAKPVSFCGPSNGRNHLGVKDGPTNPKPFLTGI